jgi:hypothetical protein
VPERVRGPAAARPAPLGSDRRRLSHRPPYRRSSRQRTPRRGPSALSMSAVRAGRRDASRLPTYTDGPMLQEAQRRVAQNNYE